MGPAGWAGLNLLAQWLADGPCPWENLLEAEVNFNILPRPRGVSVRMPFGRHQVNPTHSIGYWRGVLWCRRCGAYAQRGDSTRTRVVKLVGPCTNPLQLARP